MNSSKRSRRVLVEVEDQMVIWLIAWDLIKIAPDHRIDLRHAHFSLEPECLGEALDAGQDVRVAGQHRQRHKWAGTLAEHRFT
jgi:hypothetical protein